MTQHPTTRSTMRTNFATPNGYFKESYEYLDGSDSQRKAEGKDSDWEDEEDAEKRPREDGFGRPTSPAGSYGNRTTPRKRRKPAHITTGSRRQVSIPPSPKPARPKPEERPVIAREDVVDGALQGAIFTGRYALHVFSTAIHWLRYPLAFMLFLWLLAIMMVQVSKTFRAAFAPLCIIPGFSSSSMCHSSDSRGPSGQRAQWADYPSLVEVQSKTFEQLLDDSVGGSALSLEIKKAEMATTDLIALVRISDLKAKNTLATSLTEFVDEAKKTGRGLQKMTSKVGGAVDNIMAVNDYALQSIESARAREPSPWSLSNLAPWKPKQRSTNAIVTETFEEAMNVLSNNMQRLIVEAESNLQSLNNLEEKLSTLHEMVSREDSHLSSAQADLLAELWTKLGGNKRQLRNFDSHLTLLKDLGNYRKQSLVHVVAALMTLRAMSEDMEDMRERVAAPDLIGSTVPVEVHMKSIKFGLERLREGRIRAKKLEEDAVRRVLGIDASDNDD